LIARAWFFTQLTGQRTSRTGTDSAGLWPQKSGKNLSAAALGQSDGNFFHLLGSRKRAGRFAAAEVDFNTPESVCEQRPHFDSNHL